MFVCYLHVNFSSKTRDYATLDVDGMVYIRFLPHTIALPDWDPFHVLWNVSSFFELQLMKEGAFHYIINGSQRRYCTRKRQVMDRKPYHPHPRRCKRPSAQNWWLL